ncbi:MAG: ComF family protein [Pseudomonadota bacterium]
MAILQSVVSLIYPDQCLLCRNYVDRHGGLCAACWRDVRMISGHACDLCDAPLVGAGDGSADYCDECIATPRPWAHGRAALAYEGAGRRMILALKYGDRTDLAAPAASWMARRAADVLAPETVFVPIPAHWRRLLQRRYNPAVELARALAHQTDLSDLPDALIRQRSTPTQEGLGVDERYANLRGAIVANPLRAPLIQDAEICLVDDAMTSGATLSAATAALLTAGARRVCTLVLARAVKDA